MIMSFIVGNDISEFQGNIDWSTYKNNTNFVFIKSSEGSSYIDSWFGNNRKQARTLNIPHGFYHFARPDLGNSAQQEAQFFCNIIDGDPINTGELLALDFEVSYNDPVSWCKNWLDFVSNHFNGIKPLIYLNQSLAQTYDWTDIINAGYGLWIAAYTYSPTNNSMNIGKFPFAVIQQWTDKQAVPGIAGNVDGDVFFGDRNDLEKYGYALPTALHSQSQNTNTAENAENVSTPQNPPDNTNVKTPPTSPENSTLPTTSATQSTNPKEGVDLVQKQTLLEFLRSLWDLIKKYLNS